MIRSFSWLLLLSLTLASPALATDDWSAWTELETVDVLTENADGTTEETIIWILVQDGFAYIRTSEDSGWGDNVDRLGSLSVRGESETRTVTTTAVTDAGARQSVIDGFRAKYGWFDAMINFVRGDARIWRIETGSA